MKWTRLTIKTTTEAEDVIISEMYELGLMGAQIEDNVPLTAREKEQMFVDILPESSPDDGRALLHFFVEVAGDKEDKTAGSDEGIDSTRSGFDVNGLGYAQDNSYSYVSGDNVVEDLPGLMECMRTKLDEIAEYMDIGEGTIEVSETEDKDWANNWKEFFKPFAIDDLWIVPTWVEKVSPEWKKVLRIDPGSAFGTGMHETTQLCIRALSEYTTSDTHLLDVGTGSGILGIVSLLFGAVAVEGTDLDICAVDAVAENLRSNGIDERAFSLTIGNVITDEKLQKALINKSGGGFDIVCANILAEVLLPLTPVAAKCLKEGGIYITSGILEGKEEMVADACKNAGLKVLDIRAMGEWRCVIAAKR